MSKTVSPQWIPVKERLPENDEVCLACGKNGGRYVVRFWTDGVGMVWTRTGCGKTVHPIAWMELPDRYRGGDEA